MRSSLESKQQKNILFGNISQLQIILILSDIPGTGKVCHEMFKASKLLESMSKSAEYGYIPKATHDAISAKWLQRWTDLHYPLHVAGYCLDPEFHSHDHSLCAEALCDLFCMCDKVHGAGSAASAKAQLDWSCAYKAKTGMRCT